MIIHRNHGNTYVFCQNVPSNKSTSICISRVIQNRQGHSSDMRSVAFSPDGTKIVSGSGDNTVRIWDAIAGTLVSTLQGHSSDVTSVAFSPDGTKIVSGSYDNTVHTGDV